MPVDLRDMVFCIVEANGSDLVWLFRGSLQRSLPMSIVCDGSTDGPLTAMLEICSK